MMNDAPRVINSLMAGLMEHSIRIHMRLEIMDSNHPAAAEKKFAFLAEFLYLLCTRNLVAA